LKVGELMFTGLIEEVGQIQEMLKKGNSYILTINANNILDGIELGDSIAVNGICLTVTNYNQQSFTVDVMPETVKRTNLAQLSIGSLVNLERAMSPMRRFGGHFVAGHVDGVAVLMGKQVIDNAVYLRFQATYDLTKYMVEKGSIAIDGISLTLVEAGISSFVVSIIPHTLANTNLKAKKIGDTVNIEVDMIGKFVERYVKNHLEHQENKRSLTEEFLKENGFFND